ncbi:killer cell lectin-like receptor subfamily G member 2 isoform X3 [Haemorhous mexicanus]|uniref:killer cell lectin-like receptor subfamily G member 2 isoform X3 n=1 Tax=Haemorhous mexicanus TaxID=30427 RepID=UPI0028BE6B7B|nr:killer cell lectin-like receptor subfamily G member 2 isoform X3 [Haemorhous mexicanus]
MSLWCNKTNPENQTGHFHDSSGLAFPVPSPARCSPIPLSSPLLAASPHADLSHRPKAAQTPPSAACGTSSSARGAGVAARGELAVDVGDSFSPGCHDRWCKAVPEAELPKALPALLNSPKEGADCSRETDANCEKEESKFCSIHGSANEPQDLQEGPAAEVELLPGVQEVTWHKQGNVTCERAESADVENGFCTRDGSVREPLGPQGKSAANKEDKRNLRRLLGQWFRSHPVGAALLILLLLGLVLALGVALAVQSAPQVPVPPATLQCCPFDWLGYRGVCYYFSRDYSTWGHGQERCSQLNASLAIAEDEEAMDLLFRLRGNGDFWLGLRRRGERLQWEDGSSYSSRCVLPVMDERSLAAFIESPEPFLLCSVACPGAGAEAQSAFAGPGHLAQPSPGIPAIIPCTIIRPHGGSRSSEWAKWERGRGGSCCQWVKCLCWSWQGEEEGESGAKCFGLGQFWEKNLLW